MSTENNKTSAIIPLTGAEELDMNTIDEKVRKNDIEAVLDVSDRILLVKELGLSSYETKMLRGIWEKLRDRRIKRKHSRQKKRKKSRAS